MRKRRVLIPFVSLALLFSIASCAQGEVNRDRLPGGVSNGPVPSGDAQVPGGGTQVTDGVPQDPAGGATEYFLPPPEFDQYADVENSTFEDTRAFAGGGTVLFTVSSAKLYDSPEEAGIGDGSCAVSDMSKYDHYIKIDVTVKNVDVSDLGEIYGANNFKLRGHVYFEYVDPVWFNLGGQADDEARAYFHYRLPPAGETMEISLVFGLSDSDLAAFRASDGIWLTYDVNVFHLQRMKLEGLI